MQDGNEEEEVVDAEEEPKKLRTLLRQSLESPSPL